MLKCWDVGITRCWEDVTLGCWVAVTEGDLGTFGYGDSKVLRCSDVDVLSSNIWMWDDDGRQRWMLGYQYVKILGR